MRPVRSAPLFCALTLLPACGSVDSTVSDARIDSAVPPMIDAGESIDAGPSCDPAVQAVVDDSCGVFVDATSGDDGNAATSAAPLKTLAAALAQVPSGGAVYACSDAPLDGNVTIPAGVKIYGGLACGTWAYDASTPTIVSAPPNVVPFTLASGAGTTLVFDTPGGGGFGPARERDRRAVARDVENGLVSEAVARDTYGAKP